MMYTKKTNKLLQWLHHGKDFCTAFSEKLDFYLHHEHNSVECDHRHDGVFKGGRHHKLPHPVLKAQLVLGHVTCQGSGVDGKVYTSSLQNDNHGVWLLVLLSIPPVPFVRTPDSHLVLFQTIILHHLVSLLLKGDDDESHEDVDEEEGEDHEVHHVKDGHLHPVSWARTLVLISRIH